MSRDDLVQTNETIVAEVFRGRYVAMPPVTEVTEDALTAFNSTETRLTPVPGGGGIMSAATLALFYQGLLNGHALGGKEIWRKDTLKTAKEMEEIAAFLNIVNDPASQPVYVHCVGGRHRTGVMTAVYRMTHDGITAI